METMTDGNLKTEKSDRTKAVLIQAGIRLFSTHGFNEVGLETLADEAGVTTGAIYHNFGSKKALFREVHASVARQVLDTAKDESRIAFDIQDSQSIERAIVGFGIAFETLRKRDVRRILLEDGPTILGAQSSRSQFNVEAIRILKEGLDSLTPWTELEGRSNDLLAHMLFGALIEATDVDITTEGFQAEFERIIAAMVGI